MSGTVIDARKVFGNRRQATLTGRFEAELSAFERPCSDRAGTFIDMFEAVAWARQCPHSAIWLVLKMNDDLPDGFYVSRLAKVLYGDARNRFRAFGRNGRIETLAY
jgi:hypothetical protein